MTDAYNDFEKGLNKHSYFKVNNRELGENLVQDTFLKTLRYLTIGGKINTMKAFLYHTLNNLIIDEYRKNKKTVSLDVLIEGGFDWGDEGAENILNVLDAKSTSVSTYSIAKEISKNYGHALYPEFIIWPKWQKLQVSQKILCRFKFIAELKDSKPYLIERLKNNNEDQ